MTTQNRADPVRLACTAGCASVPATRDVTAHWDIGKQEWVMNDINPTDEPYCPQCGGGVEEQPIGSTYTVQVGYFDRYNAATFVVEADSPAQACEQALAQAATHESWKQLDCISTNFVDAIGVGCHESPWDAPEQVDVPEDFENKAAMLA